MSKTIHILTRAALALFICVAVMPSYFEAKASTTKAMAPQSPKLTVSGIVKDEAGNPVIGAGIVEVGTMNGTVSDVDGKFSITVAEKAILEVSCIGYTSQSITVDGTSLNIVLSEDEELLEEVVVIGYGETTRKNFTGSVAKVELKDSPISMIPSSNVYSLLNGTAPGVYITPSATAGGTPSILVRGQRSISGSSSPLIVLDGVIFSGSINDIDVSSIESVSVLKDASTLASYGTRAANGVIMITTKKGELGKPVINFAPNLTISRIGYKPQMRSAEGYKELMNLRSGLDPKADPIWMSDLERNNFNTNDYTDWMDYVTRTGVTQNYSLSFSGATANSNYYLSYNHWDEKGVYQGDHYNRNTINVKVSTKVNKSIEIGANANLTFNGSDGVRPSYGSAVTMSPFGEPKLKNGNMRKYPDGKEVTTVNPLWNTYNGIDSNSKGSSQVVGAFLNIKFPFLQGLSFKITGTYSRRYNESNYFTHENNFPEITLGDEGYTQEIYKQHLRETSGSISSSTSNNWVLDNILTYSRTFGKHYVNATLVYTRDESVMDSRGMTGSDFTGVGNTILGIYGLTNAEVQKISSINNVRTANIGYLARVNYSFADKYHLNVAVRRDGASVFGENMKWGIFPSVGLAWSLGRENFMKSVNFLDDLKLKVSWGKNGNQSISAYSTLSPVSMGRNGGQFYYFDNEVSYGQVITAIGNPDLGWEETTSFNGGFETSLFKGRLTADVSAYKSITTNQIFNRTIAPMSSGMTSQKATMGRIDNWGIEAMVNGSIIRSKDWNWNAGLTFSLNRNKLVDLYGNGEDDIANSLFLGQSLGAIYGYRWVGIVQKGEENYMSNMVATPGDAKYADVNGDGKLTEDDREILGFSKESFRMALNTTVSWKNLSLYMLFNGTFGGGKYGYARNNSAFLTEDSYFYHNTLEHPYWTEENKSNVYPRFNYTDGRFCALQRYTFIRLQDVNLSYNFSQNIVNRIGIGGLRVYVSASNLFCWAPEWQFSDPAIRSYSSPQLQRSVTFGLNIKF